MSDTFFVVKQVEEIQVIAHGMRMKVWGRMKLFLFFLLLRNCLQLRDISIYIDVAQITLKQFCQIRDWLENSGIKSTWSEGTQ